MIFNHNLFLTINGLAGRWSWLDTIGGFIGGDWFLYLMILFVALLWFNKSLRNKVYTAVVSVIVARIVIVEILKRLVDKPRPYEVLQVHQLIVDNEKGLSFPSGHAAIYFAIAFSFWGTKYFWPLFIAAFFGSVFRVFVGVHYPDDILIGAVIGGFTSWLLQRLFKKQFLT